jgi:hypothetical protein
MIIQKTDLLLVHPLAQRIHVESDPDYPALLASVRDLGIIEPLKVTRSDGQGESPGYLYVVDGNRRWKAARESMLSEVPVKEVDPKDAASIILHSLVARRHLTKGALAYVAYPILKPALAEARARQLECQKKGQTSVSASKSRSSIQSTTGSVEDIAASLGMGRDLIFMAQAIHKKFADHPGLREIWEPKIIAGEMGLGQVQQAISGKIAAIDGQTTPKGDPAQLLFEFLDMAVHRLDIKRWQKLDPSQRADALGKFREHFLPNLPEEFLKEAETYLRNRRANTKTRA